MHKAVIIRTDDSREVVEFEAGESYPLLREAVGGFIECVTLRDKNFADMWLNEEGKVIGLPFNAVATLLWASMYGFSDVMVGDVVITGSCDEEGETLGLSDEEVEFFMNYATDHA
jgi:hypothetical protein